MLIPTTISFILGKNIIYKISRKQELLEDERKGDIYEEFEDKNKKSLKISKKRYFNKGKFLIKIKQYKYELIFKDDFNESVVLPKSLTHLTFGWRFNQPINLLDSITHLTFNKWSSFNQPIELPKDLTHLSFGCCFNQQVNLPEKITHLTFGHNFNQPINLPDSITHLILGGYFNESVELPKSLKHLKIYDGNKNLKVKYNDVIIKIKNLPIKISYYN